MFGFRANLSGINALLDKLVQSHKTEAVKSAAAVIIADVREKTLSGKTPSGEEFRPYTKPYAAKRKAKGLETDHVDLKVTGGLLDSLTFFEADMMVSVDDPHQPIAQGLSRKREFLGQPGDSTVERIEEKVARSFERS